jgi:hypothetical protein
MKAKKYIVQYHMSGRWNSSMNYQADGEYTKASAERRARTQERKSVTRLKYRIKEVK